MAYDKGGEEQADARRLGDEAQQRDYARVVVLAERGTKRRKRENLQGQGAEEAEEHGGQRQAVLLKGFDRRQGQPDRGDHARDEQNRREHQCRPIVFDGVLARMVEAFREERDREDDRGQVHQNVHQTEQPAASARDGRRDCAFMHNGAL